MTSESIEICLTAYETGASVDRDIERSAVKEILAVISAQAPGKSVELRIPPYAAIQVVEGPNHRRGTPSAVVEMNARVLLGLAVGEISWEDAVRDGTVIASGERSNLSHLFPC